MLENKNPFTMKQYFIHDGQNKPGPYKFEELQSKQISSETLLWFEGLESWTKAANIPELINLLKPTPSPQQQTRY